MLLLTNTTDYLQLLTSSTISVDWTSSYVDVTTTTFVPSSSQGNVTSATSTTIVGPPGASTQRQVKFLSIRNRDASSTITVTVIKNAGAVQYRATPDVPLLAGEMLQYVDGVGFEVFDSSGRIKSAIANVTGPTGPQGIPGPAMADPEPGEDGIPGPPGTPGQQGVSGTTGAQGPVGPAVYLDAESGEEGPPGPPGLTGIAGSAGSTGAQGPIGPAVYLEADIGEEGPLGPPGLTGPIGVSGSTGAQGPTGPAIFLEADSGEEGQPGPPGAQGPQGIQGPAGSSSGSSMSGFLVPEDPLDPADYVSVSAAPPISASPSALVGLTAVAGSAYTFMRSDAAPALDVTIAPTWTGLHTFNRAATPAVRLASNTGPFFASSAGTLMHMLAVDGTATSVNIDAVAVNPGIKFRRINGTSALPTAPILNDSLGVMSWLGYDGTSAFSTAVQIQARATEAWSATVNGAQLRFLVTPNGAAAVIAAATVENDGGLFMLGATGSSKGSGTINATALYVNGTQLTGANPTASLGLTAVNGTAVTYMRSDGAPALDQTIAPTWTGVHVWTSNSAASAARVSAAAPSFGLVSTGAVADGGKWRTISTALGTFAIQAVNDAVTLALNGIQIARNQVSFGISGITFGNITDNPTYSFVGTGRTTTTGPVTVGSATAITAGGSKTAGVSFTSATDFGVYTGSGVPTISAAQGSLYLRSDGSSTTTRTYVNTDGATTWQNLLAGSGGGGGVSVTEIEVDFGATPSWDASFTITDGAVGASNSILISESGKAATGRVAGDSQWDSISTSALPGTGSFVVYCKAHPGPVVGKRKLQYMVV